MYEGRNYIDGDWVAHYTNAALLFDAVNPATEEVYGKFPNGKADAERAVWVARRSFDSWRKESRVRRAEYFDVLAQLIKRDHNKLKEAISVETGKNLNESHAEVIEALHMCQFAAASGREAFGMCVSSELPTKDAYVIRKPRGVVAVISPWNFPLAIGSFWSSAPALVEGNTVVHKPSELTPMVNQMVAELYHEAGFPPGVYNLVHGDGTVGDTLVRGDVDVVLFTGSAEVGQDIRKHCAETHSKTCSIECGSKSATIVFEDGDMELALDATVASAFKLSGQRCVSSGRILVQKSIFDEFAEEFAERACNLGIGCPFDNPDSFFGPLISAEQRDKVCVYNQLVRDDQDAVVLCDCGVPASKHVGHFLNPFVYRCEWDDKPFLKEEVFGPHVALIPFDDLDDAIRIYNDTKFGLALGVITDDFRKHRRLAQDCITGMLYINGSSIGAESHLPFSSWKASGYGSSAAGTYKAVTHTMSVTTNYEEGKMQFAQGMK